MAGNNAADPPNPIDTNLHLKDALNFDYLDSQAGLVITALSRVNKSREGDPIAALSRALLEAGGDQ